MILPNESAHAVDFVDSGQFSQLRTDHPLLDRPQAHEIDVAGDQTLRALRTGPRCFSPHFPVRRAIVSRFDRILVDLAQSGRDGTQFRRDSIGQFLSHHRQPLEDQLPRKIRIHMILEDDNHLRQAGLRQGPHLLHVGQAGHLRLDGERDQTLHLLRTQAPGLRQDHHLHVRNIGEGVNRQSQPCEDPEREEDASCQQDKKTLSQNESQHMIEHVESLS